MLGSKCPFGYWCVGIGLIAWLGSCGIVSVVGVKYLPYVGRGGIELLHTACGLGW